MDKYILPYDITEDMLELAAEITENLGKLHNVNDLERLPRLRKVNRLRSIQSSLAIENNTLSLEQVTDVVDGKRVLTHSKLIKCYPNSIRSLWKI